MRLSYKKPAQCVKELHSPEQQHANTHRLFIKMCWLMGRHAVSADRVVNIDETSCRLLPVHQIEWGRRGVKQAQLQGNTKEATTFTVALSMDRGRWTCCTRARLTPSCRRSCRSCKASRSVGREASSSSGTKRVQQRRPSSQVAGGEPR